MQQLLILRHAKAVPWSPAAEDFPRKLSSAGNKHAHRIALWMCTELESPQCILCSPSQRTRETLAPLLSMKEELESVTHFIPQIYHSSASTLVTLLNSAFAEFDRVLIVGHNPGFERLVWDVIHSRHYEEYNRLATGTLAVVDFESAWADDHDKGTLQHLVRGKHLSVG
jgi:phosphohistidine phosphatase